MLPQASLCRNGLAVDRSPLEWLSATRLTCLLGLTAIIATLFPAVCELLQFDRAAISAGQCWRVVTGNFVHWNLDHLWWDALMFVVLGAAIELRSRRVFVAVTALSALAVSATVWLATPLTIYRGLSGIDSALFVLLAVWYLLDRQQSRSDLPALIPITLLAGFIGKIGYEIVTGHTFFVDSAGAAFIPLPQVHLAGAAAGIAVLGLLQYREK